jgi:hypothetical protein
MDRNTEIREKGLACQISGKEFVYCGYKNLGDVNKINELLGRSK